MESRNRSPRITHVSWGRLEVEGETEPYKDAKVFPGGSREWNWRETKTAHTPGIQIPDVQGLLDHGAKVVVLSRGMAECLHVPRETLDFLEQRQIPVHVLPTQAPPAAPKALNDSNETASSFTANWTSVSGATGYRLDVSTSNNFTSYVPGYQDLNVGNVISKNVTGLTANTFYYYRVRAFNGNTSPNSNVIKAKTKNH